VLEEFKSTGLKAPIVEETHINNKIQEELNEVALKVSRKQRS